ncbi:FtsX-like permease family protein [Phototrophicus methaneseepsis]|uniref:FtsX-like permease family protein n=1 Tax=Phototrophicus methaneseepsis TaxID=2710758 RepID=A0A7S8IFL1_9CHLR|nr:FtsX-like permease family protein [Phototrophicus methaneseepsis]QPC83716.1 FtsX-like permease family protein [Phototrophicus methaneseepsis]
MRRYLFFIKYALRGLRRGGQRVLIAMLAVGFGVMSLITMGTIAQAMQNAMETSPELVIGGDLRISKSEMVSNEEISNLLGPMQAEGLITSYSPVSEFYEFMMRTADSSRIRYISRLFGVDPTTYPIAGDITIKEPANSTLSDLISELGTTVVTRDIADEYGLKVGDTMRLTSYDGEMSLAMPLTITGIVNDNPSHMGRHVYYSLETTEALFSETAIYDYVVVQTDHQEEAAAAIGEAGWFAQRADLQVIEQSSNDELFVFMVQGAGILGLLVGGIGIANTMQVLLTQRKHEVGILKTLGYSQQDMIFIFVLEAGLLGVVGSVVGALLSMVVANGIMQIFSSSSTLLMQWTPDPRLMGGGILIGIVTTVIFAMYAIVSVSSARPTVIFRRETRQGRSWRGIFTALGFYALLAIPFSGVTSLFLGSVIKGVGILLFALVGLVVLGIGLGILTWVILRIMPTFNFNLLRMARNNMRKRAFSMIFAMIALFVGVFTLGFAMTIIQVSLSEYSERNPEIEGYNLQVLADTDTAPEVVSALEAEGVEAVNARYSTSAGQLSFEGADNYWDNSALQIRSMPWDIDVLEGPELGSEIGVYVYAPDEIELNGEMSYTMPDGTVYSLPILGRYVSIGGTVLNNIYQPVISWETYESLGSPALNHVEVYAMADNARVQEIASTIGQAFPDVLTTNSIDLMEEVNGMFLNIFYFALSMSGLALLAGVMLIANVVSLAMMERRYEIGVMKAVGYTQSNVLLTIVLEYGLVGFVASIVGIVGVQAMITFITFTQSAAEGMLFIEPITAVIILIVGLGLTQVTALTAAWSPAKIRPLAILNERAS